MLFEAGKEKINRTMTANLMGPWWLTRPGQLAAHSEGQLQVQISMSGKRNRVGGLHRQQICPAGPATMRNEGWEAGIRVTAICPGW